MDNIYAKLIRIQAAAAVPKSHVNEFGGFNYRNAEDILKVMKPLCEAEGLALFLSDEAVEVGGWHYIMAIASLTDGNECITVKAFAREADSRPKMDVGQLTGAASSYARKYALNGLFGLDDGKDLDSLEPPKTETVKEVLQRVADRAKSEGIRPEQITAFIKQTYNKASKDLTLAEARELLRSFDNLEVSE